MIELENATVSYADKPVLHNINLRIAEGEKVALIGPSGAGKTTLLRKMHDLEPRRSAFIHQDHALVPQLSVFHNVYAARLDEHSTLRNFLNLIKPQKRDLNSIIEILRTVGLEDRIGDKVANLSGGQQQRVAVARAVHRCPEIILGDEPVSSIDPKQSEFVLNVLLTAARTIVVSLHSVHLALQLFDRIIALNEGQIKFDLVSSDVGNEQLQRLFSF